MGDHRTPQDRRLDELSESTGSIVAELERIAKALERIADAVAPAKPISDEMRAALATARAALAAKWKGAHG